MKKFFLFSLLPFLAYSNINDFNAEKINENDKNNFEIVSTKYTYFHSIKSRKEEKYYLDLMNSIDKNRTVHFQNQIKDIEKIFVRIFKSEKNLVPKVIKYIYFEPIKTEDNYLLNEQVQKIMVAFNANSDSKIFINNTNGNANQFLDRIYSRASKEQVILIENTDKEIFKLIRDEIKKDFPKRNTFTPTEVRLLVISASSKVKEKLALSTTFFNKEFKGVEIDDFSYLDQKRYLLDTTDQDTRNEVFKSFIYGIY
ncbi:hypothetical protein STFE110948_04510 [Streptobacillus felis]|uniref:hypothetical protein n=1 Tax=Streptobacillus felis TaxID=1384509 RepID=UPI000830640D|nr:hypothetical protein [Streptobacillus felis]